MQRRGEVLVIDDVIAIVEELVTLLSWHEVGAHGATNLTDALEVLTECPEIRVVACDVRLDRESGLDIIPRILEHPELRRRPFRFLFMSGDPMQVQHFPAASEHYILTKPVQPRVLMRAITSMLGPDADPEFGNDREAQGAQSIGASPHV
ncbi:response regulator receiver domain-containing protein [Novosphingobium sp. PhB165]|uniref:response regulator n=1 Tax=Novosphingobium sp. PhB165 TaxID=2485105 RepID=UPI0010497588|nr:response regulator [Novosphingobium sp. PhB165]TCM15378.1 response regulator receiver domain-containing protein [Novosphingobium sp. PhB165]